MKEQDFDKFFAERLKDIEVNPPANLWTNIESALEEEETVPVKKIFPWKSLLAAASILLLLGLLFNVYLHHQTVQQDLENLAGNQAVPEAQEEIKQEVSPLEKETASVIASDINKPKANHFQVSKQVNRVDLEDTPVEDFADDSVENELFYANTEKVVPIAYQKLEEELYQAIERPELEIRASSPTANIDMGSEMEQAATSGKKGKQGLVVRLLNNITENINILNKDVAFSQDEEGTLKIDVFNSLAKTKN